MTPARWESADSHCFGFLLGRIDPLETALLVLINGGDVETAFTLPAPSGSAWMPLLDTAHPAAIGHEFGVVAVVPARGLLVLASTGGNA